MYCRYCGKEIPENSNYCPNCGKKQNEEISIKGFQSFLRMGKYKKAILLYVVWCLIHIGLFVFSPSGEGCKAYAGPGHGYCYRDKIDAFYPFDTSLSNVLQWKPFWCDWLNNIDVYDFSELFFYTILFPLLIWGINKILPVSTRIMRNVLRIIKTKYQMQKRRNIRRTEKGFFNYTETLCNATKEQHRPFITKKNIIIVIVVLVCYILLGIKTCNGNSQEKKVAMPADADSIEEVVDSVIDGYEEYLDDYPQKLEQEAPADMDSIEEVVDEDLRKIDNDQLGMLKTGDTPYEKYYGKNMICKRAECTGIKVTAPETSDVVVIVKKNNEHGKVAGHAYISAGDTYKIDLPDGTYQTFFYYGDGWNANKDMGNGIKGGFVRDEVFSKDDPQDIYSAVLSYVLQLRRDGNFHAESSNRSEVF